MNYSVYGLHIYQLLVVFLLTFLELWAALSARMYTRQMTFVWPLLLSHSHFYYVIFPSQYTTISPFLTGNYDEFVSSFIATSLSQMTALSSEECSYGRPLVWSVPMTAQCGSSSVADHMGIFSTMQCFDFVHTSRTLVAPLR